jgi:hypothetical protein
MPVRAAAWPLAALLALTPAATSAQAADAEARHPSEPGAARRDEPATEDPSAAADGAAAPPGDGAAAPASDGAAAPPGDRAAAPSGEDVPAPTADAPSAPAHDPGPGIGLAVVGAAFAAAGAVILGVAGAEHDRVRAAPDGASWPAYRAALDLANAGFVSGALAAVCGAAIVALGIAVASSRASVTIRAGPTSLAVEARF